MSSVIVILAPTGRDAAVIAAALSAAGIEGRIAPTISDLVNQLSDRRVGAILATEEAFGAPDQQRIVDWLSAQPPWSDLPVLLLTRRAGNVSYQTRLVAALGNVTILERPFHAVTLVSAARAALRARARQHQAEAHILELAARGQDLSEERTRLKASEARLKEANEKLGRRFAVSLAEKRILAEVVETTDAFVQVADLNFRWLAINRASREEFARIFGVRPEVGMSMLDVLRDMPEHQVEVEAVWKRALQGEEFTVVGEFGDPGRRRRFYEMKFNTLRDADGVQIGAYQFVYDVTERIRSQEQLAEAQAQVHEMAKLETLGQLTGGVAHDFNNLLTPILGALDMLYRRHEDDARSTRLITAALEGAERATVLVQRLLSFARRQHLEARAIDVGSLIQGTQDLIQRSIGPHVVVDVRIAEGLPPARIDPNQLELAVLNLAVNASDAMPGGGSLTIEVSSQALPDGEFDQLPPGSYIRLSVADTGSGMDEATIRRAIEPFFTTKGVGKGTGLGLSMVHGLAAQSGGTLRIVSQLGEGTTVELWLPTSEGDAESLQVGEAAFPPQARNAVILLVDDDALVLSATADMLRHLGYGVVEANSATQALKLLANHPEIDALITDYLMPRMRGSELIRQAQGIRPALPAMLMTGYARLTSGEEEVARLPKPFRAIDLAHAVTKLLTGVRPAPSTSENDAPYAI